MRNRYIRKAVTTLGSCHEARLLPLGRTELEAEYISRYHEFKDPLSSVSWAGSSSPPPNVKWGQVSEFMVMEKLSWKPQNLVR